jgi:uncharacterized protein YdaT
MSPWTSSSFAKKHNKKLSKSQSKKAAKIANAILAETGDEGLAIATANKLAKKKPKKKKKK